MTIKIYNTLKREKEEFTPIKKDRVGMYVCGPTVYDVPHIGHARSAYIFDVIRRYFLCKGYTVKFVRNVTDVDDKIITRAKEEFGHEEIGTAVKKTAQKYLKAYHDDMDMLGIMYPDVEPKATEYIDKIIEFIQVLIERGMAYQSEGDVYFDIKKARDYGRLSNQSLDKMDVGVRISPGENKRDPLDFALWKSSKEGEPSWESPWGKGRPGWHIECSVMSSDILGGEFDIHGGGVDLIFPHHENEIAQSEGAGKKFARVWIHNGLLTINGEKMAKSLGNFVVIKDFINKYCDMDILKLFFLSTHYSHPIDYTEQKIEEAKKQKKSFNDFFDKINYWQLKEGETKTSTAAKDKVKINDICAKFQKAMDDDLNTPKALASLFELIDLSSSFVSNDKEDAFNYAKSKLEIFFNIFGLKTKLKKKMSDEIRNKIKEREQARKNKDFRKADHIRQELKTKFKINVSDTNLGVTFTEIE